MDVHRFRGRKVTWRARHAELLMFLKWTGHPPKVDRDLRARSDAARRSAST